MTYKGLTYECVLDLIRLKVVCKAQLKAYISEYEVVKKLGDSDLIQECSEKIKVQRNFIKILEQNEIELMDDIKSIAEEMSDIEWNVFVCAFVKGLSCIDTIKELNIQKTTYYKYMEKIINKIEDTNIERKLKNDKEV